MHLFLFLFCSSVLSTCFIDTCNNTDDFFPTNFGCREKSEIIRQQKSAIGKYDHSTCVTILVETYRDAHILSVSAPPSTSSAIAIDSSSSLTNSPSSGNGRWLNPSQSPQRSSRSVPHMRSGQRSKRSKSHSNAESSRSHKKEISDDDNMLDLSKGEGESNAQDGQDIQEISFAESSSSP